MGRRGSGVELRDSSIRISYTLAGKPYKHTLMTNGVPMAPTRKNELYANRLAEEIRQKIRFGTFNPAEYFPDSAGASTASVPTVEKRLNLWLELQGDKEPSTIKGYRIAVNWWNRHIGSKLLPALVHSDILGALASEPKWSGKTRNNKVSVLRLALQLAVRDNIIATNPADGIEPSSHQSPEPDPFTIEEAEAIIAGLAKHYSEPVANYFGAKFYTGLRTSESMAQQWGWLDTRKNVLAVSEGIVMGLHKKSTKTSKIRLVQLNSRAMEFYIAQKPHSFLHKEGWIFPDPKTGDHDDIISGWVGIGSQLDGLGHIGIDGMYYNCLKGPDVLATGGLKKLGIRYRSPYDTRHTYATMLLMAGVTPAFAAKQMGHSVQMFLTTYARWVDGGMNDYEMDKLETMLQPGQANSKKA